MGCLHTLFALGTISVLKKLTLPIADRVRLYKSTTHLRNKSDRPFFLLRYFYLSIP